MNKEFLAKILENHKNGFIVLNNNKKVIYSNQIMKKIFSLDTNMLLGNYMNCVNTVNEKKLCQMTTMCNKCIINKMLDEILIDKQTKVISNLEFNSKGNIIDINCQLEYMDEYIIMEFFDLYINDQNIFFINKLLDKANDMMFFKNAKGKYIYANRSYAEFLNKNKHDIIDKRDVEILSKELLRKCSKSDKIALEKGQYCEVEEIFGTYYKLYKQRVNEGIVCVGKDITDEVLAYKKATIDELTGLFNRRRLDDTVDSIYKNKERGYYLLVIDLDNLRGINTLCGHPGGDSYLKQLSDILSKYSEGIFFRIGGDEFIGLINKNIIEVKNILENIFEELNKLDLTPKLTISVGIKELDLSKEFLENYRLADRALYDAKNTGKNRYAICRT